jgi:plastocyanin
VSGSVYQWWVFVHLVGVFGFLIAHGVSVSLSFRLRKERDPQRVSSLIQLSGSSIRAFYASMFVLLLGGVVAGFLGNWWHLSQFWLWGAVVILVVTSLGMSAMARPYYRRVGLVARAMAGGSTAVTEDQFDAILRSRRPYSIAAMGFVALGAILYLMLFKPTFGTTAPAPGGGQGVSTALHVTAKGIAFDTQTLRAPDGKAFTIVFDNQDSEVHNVAVYANESATKVLFRGGLFNGPKTMTYHVKALPAGTYFFRCDAHPQKMTGTFEVGGTG